MQNIYFFSGKRNFIFSFLFFLLSITAFAQVGINTTNPRTMLEVAGDVNINGGIKINEINHIRDSDNTAFLTQTPNGFIKELNALEGDGLVIAYFQEYKLSNMLGDWVEEFNTNIPASKYVLTIISTYFNQELKMESSQSDNFSFPYCSAYIAGNPATWRIVADYPGALPNSENPGEWVISTLILSKEFSNVLPQQEVIFPRWSDRRSGAANSPVIE